MNDTTSVDSAQSPDEPQRLAPTEKHLEDWLVDHPDCLDPWTGRSVQVVARQFCLPSGRADLVTRQHEGIFAVEIKKGSIDAKAVTQVMRYIADLREIWRLAVECLPVPERNICLISGTLVGHDITSDALRALPNSGVSAFIYRYDDNHYTVEPQDGLYMHQNTASEYAVGAIGIAMRGVLAERLQRAQPNTEMRDLNALWNKLQEEWENSR